MLIEKLDFHLLANKRIEGKIKHVGNSCIYTTGTKSTITELFHSPASEKGPNESLICV